MDANEISADWIVAYMEWRGIGDADDPERYAVPQADHDGSRCFALAYLEWLDVGRVAAQAAACESVLLSALRAESECLRILRGAIAELELQAVQSVVARVGEQAAIEANWQDVPKEIAADLRALTGKVLSLQAH